MYCNPTLVDGPRSLLTRFGNQLTGVLLHNLITKNAIHENVDSVFIIANVRSQKSEV